MTTKFCPRCGKRKATAEFGKVARYRSGLATYCLVCQRLFDREWYWKNRSKVSQRTSLNKKRRREEHIRKLVAYLQQHPCVDCGESDPLVLDFDHVRGKKSMEVTVMVGDKGGWAAVEKEIAKCAVRCANCHRRKTAKEKHTVRYRILMEGRDVQK